MTGEFKGGGIPGQLDAGGGAVGDGIGNGRAAAILLARAGARGPARLAGPDGEGGGRVTARRGRVPGWASGAPGPTCGWWLWFFLPRPCGLVRRLTTP